MPGEYRLEAARGVPMVEARADIQETGTFIIISIFSTMNVRIIIALTYFLPFFAFAAETPTDFKSLVGLFLGIINTLIYLIFAGTILVLIWGILRAWVIGGGDAHKVEDGKKLVLIGIITLVIMTSLWGILQVLQSSLLGGSNSTTTETSPTGVTAKCMKNGMEIPIDHCPSQGGTIVWP